MTKMDWTKSFKLNALTLRTTGVWPKGDGSYGFNIYTLYTVLSGILFHIIFISFQTVNLYFIKDDLKAITGTIFILLTDIGCSLKTYGLIKNMKMLKKLMATVNADLFQPKNERQKQLIMPNIRFWKMTVSVFWFFSCGCLVLWSLFPILDKTYKQHRLPFLSWYPYSTKVSPQYEITYIYQCVAISFLAILNVSIDNMIAYLNMYIGAQFDILCDDLRNLYDPKKDSPGDVEKKLRRCVDHHREILKFADYVNQFYNWLLFVQFFVSGISIGLAMFQLTVVVPFSSEFHSLVSYANAVSVQIFMYCWFGNEIEIKSSKLPYAVFESDWTSFSPAMKKNLIIFVLRIQKSLQISAFGLFYLSLDTFVRILRTAWSYFALLRQVNQPTQNL